MHKRELNREELKAFILKWKQAGFTNVHIAGELEVSKQSIDYHVNKLIDSGELDAKFTFNPSKPTRSLAADVMKLQVLSAPEVDEIGLKNGVRWSDLMDALKNAVVAYNDGKQGFIKTTFDDYILAAKAGEKTWTIAVQLLRENN